MRGGTRARALEAVLEGLGREIDRVLGIPFLRDFLYDDPPRRRQKPEPFPVHPGWVDGWPVKGFELDRPPHGGSLWNRKPILTRTDPMTEEQIAREVLEKLRSLGLPALLALEQRLWNTSFAQLSREYHMPESSMKRMLRQGERTLEELRETME